jgi:hypothetical protein
MVLRCFKCLTLDLPTGPSCWPLWPPVQVLTLSAHILTEDASQLPFQAGTNGQSMSPKSEPYDWVYMGLPSHD